MIFFRDCRQTSDFVKDYVFDEGAKEVIRGIRGNKRNKSHRL